MIPEQRLSTTPVRGRLLNPRSRNDRVSFHRGPVALSDTSQGLTARMWRLRALDDGLFLGPTDGAESLLLTTSGIASECSLAFDQLGRPSAAFVEAGVPKLYWFDSVAQAFVTDTLAAGTINPRVTLDDARENFAGSSDIILGYVRAGGLYYRQQRDRFTVERLLREPAGGLSHISMADNLRLHFLVRA